MNNIVKYELVIKNYGNDSNILEEVIPIYDPLYQPEVEDKWNRFGNLMDDLVVVPFDEEEGILVVPDGVKKIGHVAFAKCDSLRVVILPESVRAIEESAFYACENLEEIHLPKKMDYIEKYAFFGCKSLKKIELPSGLDRLEEGLFCECQSLEQLEVPYGVERIDGLAFDTCVELRKIELPDTLWKIGEYAFNRCISLEELHLPDSMTELGEYALKGMTLLKRLFIPDGITELDTSVFMENLEWLEVDEHNFVYWSKDGMLFTKDRKQLLYCPRGKKGEVEIPEGTTSMSPDAFDGCDLITRVKFPALC